MAKTNRKTSPLKGDESIETVQGWHGDYAATQAQIKSITGTMEQELAAVRAKYEPQLTPLIEQSEELAEKMQWWAEANKASFDKKRSKETLFGKFGFRTGTPKLKLVKGFTWESVLNLLKKGQWGEYVRTKDEVNKEAILAAAEQLEKQGGFFGKENTGIYVDQDEAFFIEVKEEQPATA